LYQPDLLLLKCAKNGLRYRSQRLSSQKEFNGQKPIRIEPVQLGLQLEPLCMGEPEIVLGDNPTKVVQLFERNDREKRSVIDQKLKGRMQSLATIRGAGHVLVGQKVEETVSNDERAIDAGCFLRAHQ
jgi:hypothetical protein